MISPRLNKAAGFHQAAEVALRSVHGPNLDRFTYTFENAFHPYVGQLIKKLNRSSLSGMLDPDFLEGLREDRFFESEYTALGSGTVQLEAHAKDIDVSIGGPYAGYNWELFYHVPVAIAVHLSNTQRFADAQKWFHYVFDPSKTDPWRFLAFRHQGEVPHVDDLLLLLSTPDGELSSADQARKKQVHTSYAAVLGAPFQPHAVARARPSAYQYYVVMKYLDNLIAWGDTLFLQDTIESINEASLCYVLGANLLGPRPQKLPSRGTIAPRTFAQLKSAGLDPMGNALVELESQLPFNSTLPATPVPGGASQNGPVSGMGRSLYFCNPTNTKLLAYWDTVADRLFKIRNCMNIAGVVRQLPLFDPPLDPGMLIKAAAAGLNVGSIVSGLNQPLGPVRSLVLIQKAAEICGELKSVGNALLAASEKHDAEQLSLLRQRHELALHEMSQNLKFLQWQQARNATESLLKSRETAMEKYRYYLRLLGTAPDAATAPAALSLDRRELTEENFDEAFGTLVGTYDQQLKSLSYPKLRLPPSPSMDPGSSGSLYLNTGEDAELNVFMPMAWGTRIASTGLDAVAAVLQMIPEIDIKASPMGMGVATLVFGGSKLGEAIKGASSVVQTTASLMQETGSMMARKAGYERRADEWLLQANLAAHELMQLGRQILGALIAEQVAHHEHTMAQAQVKQAQEVDHFLRAKLTSADLYAWMRGEIARLYYQYYRFAFDVARKAEQTMKRELMRPELEATEFVKFNYWDTGRQGLLSGDALHLDLKRMEMAYHDNFKRELELTRHVSLRQLDPIALLQLRTTGACTVTIPEWLLDRDCPGHYMRRIKSVALSLPSVVGPYAGVHCTLTLQRSTIRVSPALRNDEYRRAPDGPDERFADYLGSTESVVSSGGSGDAGLFEPNLRDERFLPFEGAGAVSAWSLRLSSEIRAFDYATISDVILHLRYTARDGGATLAGRATTELIGTLSEPGSGLVVLLSLPHDFPSEWAAFTNGKGDLAVPLTKSLFPYFAQSGTVTVDGLALYDAGANALAHTSVAVPGDLSENLNGQAGMATLALPADGRVLTRSRDAAVFLVVQYSLTLKRARAGAG